MSAYESGRKQPSVATLSRLLAAAGARLVVESGRSPVRSPSRARHEAAAIQILAVLEFAAALPARHAPALGYPHLSARLLEPADARFARLAEAAAERRAST